MRRVYEGEIYVREVNDSRGNLVDLVFGCEPCGQRENLPTSIGRPYADAFWFSNDYNTYCNFCGCTLTTNDCDEGFVGEGQQCYRCDEFFKEGDELAEVFTTIDEGNGETGPRPYETCVVVHVGCMREGEQIA